MENKKNILVLATYDEHGQGHGWSVYNLFKSLGFNADFICLIRKHTETKKYIIDATNTKNWKFRFFNYLRLLGFLIYPFHGNMRWFYKGYSFAKANDVLNRIETKPDYILFCSYMHFMTPKNIYKLWKATGAEMVFNMVDPQILGGGCNFPVGCNRGYEHACNPCPLYPYIGFIPKRIVAQKEKYFSRIPFHLVGVKYDLEKAENVSYLKDKIKHEMVYIPQIPFTKSKHEARKRFGLRDGDFVMLAGAVNIKNPAKGFLELMTSLTIFSEKILERKVTLLLPGKFMANINVPENITLVTPGFLSLDDLYMAFYACDVLLSPSLEDSGPMMVNYSLMCGRPVVAFPIGIAINLVKHKVTGWMAAHGDCYEFAEGINWFYNQDHNNLAVIENDCKNHIKSYSEHPWYEFMLK